MFFDNFDINKPKSVNDLFNVIFPKNSQGNLSKFFEFLSVLKGIKNAYLGYDTDEISKMYTIILFIKDLSQDDFIYIPEHKFIGNKKNTLKILSEYPGNLLESIFEKLNYKHEVILGELLSYPCPGLEYTENNKKPIHVKYILITNEIFRKLFYTDKMFIQISVSACSKKELTDKVNNKIKVYHILLNNYIESLSFGKIFLKIDTPSQHN
jgi:hypothetical protein